MGFDKDDPGPIIQPAKKTTKVNISLAVAVLVFFVLGGIIIAWMKYVHG